MLRYFTAGESHGKGLVAFLDGFPAGVVFDKPFIDAQLRRRQSGYGRGGRQKIETDEVEILTGILHGTTTGAPVVLWVKNKDYKINEMPDLEAFRPGHGDLSGSIKYHSGIRPILERASARETAAKVAAGALCQLLLQQSGIQVASYVQSIGPISLVADDTEQMSMTELLKKRDQSTLFSLASPEREDEAKKLIEECLQAGDTLGGIIEIRVIGVPFGLGTHTQWDMKLDGRLAQAIMSIQAIKGVEIGLGFEATKLRGSLVHDPIDYDAEKKETRTKGFYRSSNNAGGLEAGMSNSEPIVLRAAMKPISTLRTPLPSVHRETFDAMPAPYERSDTCAVSAASVVFESVVALEIARAMTELYGSDTTDSFLNH